MTLISTVRTVANLRDRVKAWRDDGAVVALVPTMGALHDGHLSLIHLAKTKADRVVASVFVNPMQFAPTEDLSIYPRDEATDAALLAAEGCDLLFAPSVQAMYGPGFATTITVAAETDVMEGAVRPTHFAGVATVVAKLLIQASPDVAVFGEKDYQQLHVIRRLTADLDLPVTILPAPIARAGDGLALSSRNAYLTPHQRQIAPALHLTLQATARALRDGAAVSTAETEGVNRLMDAGFDAVDYLQVRASDNLARRGPGRLDGAARILAVARLGATRLLDNIAV